MTTLLIATRNAHKVGEIRAILGAQFQFLTLNDFPAAPKVVEDADTFAGNATKKAVELTKWLGGGISNFKFQISDSALVLADDSGLVVDALAGAPGVHSARFAALERGAGGPPAGSAGNSPDAENNARLLRLLQNVPPEKRAARFRCVIALAGITPHSALRTPQLFDGVCEGQIILAPRGNNGFGYDPLFVPVDFDQTFAELGEDVKNRLSHRAKALEKLNKFLTTK
jgi:XTP/dITP diphosphohydrolase